MSGGRPPERPEGARTTAIRLPLTEVEHIEIVVAAARAQLPVTKWLRRLIRRAILFEQAVGKGPHHDH